MVGKMKIVGLNAALKDIRECPDLFHLEVWGRKVKEGVVEIWTSELLTENSWTEYKDSDYVRISDIASKIMFRTEYVERRRITIGASLRLACEQVWGEA